MKLDEAKFLVTKDNEKIIRSINEFKNQHLCVWKLASSFPPKAGQPRADKLEKIKNIIVCGMGGSALGAHIVRSVFSEKIKLPFFILNNYELPEFADKNSLVILSSYSGNTEEVLACLKDARKKHTKITALTSGGLLAKYAKQNNLPLFVFNTKNNPSGAPRMGLGYSIFGMLKILKELNLIKINIKKINQTFKNLDMFLKEWGVDNPMKKNNAKIFADKIYNKIPVLIGSEFLIGNIHTFQNQLHETSKNFSCYFELPEVNHHLMEGLTNPKNKELIFLFFESNLYHKRNQKRFALTKDVIKKNKIDFIDYKAKLKDKFSQSLEILLFGSFVSFYLSILNKENPIKNIWVDYFKKKLG